MIEQTKDDVLKSLKLLMDKMKAKVTEKRNYMIWLINSFFQSFTGQFMEQFHKEIELFEYVPFEDLQMTLEKLKGQLALKLEKLDQFEKQIAQFQVSPNLEVVDSLLKIPHQTQVKQKQIEEPPEKVKQKKPDHEYYQDKSQLKCTYCGTQSEGIFLYRKHMISHGLMLQFQCPECEFQSSTHLDTSRHLLDNHSYKTYVRNFSDLKKKDAGTYTCKYTNQSFSQVRELSNYLKHNINYHNLDLVPLSKLQIKVGQQTQPPNQDEESQQ